MISKVYDFGLDEDDFLEHGLRGNDLPKMSKENDDLNDNFLKGWFYDMISADVCEEEDRPNHSGYSECS